MNGKLEPFLQTDLIKTNREEFIKSYVDAGYSKEEVEAGFDKVQKDQIWINNEYQVNVDKNPEHGFKDSFEIWHLSIKRLDKEPIHDWRDLQEIKNMLAGKNCEAIELYPSESRKHDSANQYHLWVFYKDLQNMKIPIFPVGWSNLFVSEDSVFGSKQRAFKKS